MHATCMQDACRCSVNCEQYRKITCTQSSEKCRATCVLHASYISLDMHRMSCMSIDINVERHLLPKTNMHVLGGMHPTCRMHVDEIVHMLSNGAVHTMDANVDRYKCRSTCILHVARLACCMHRSCRATCRCRSTFMLP